MEEETLVVKNNIIVLFVPIMLFFPFLFTSFFMILLVFKAPWILLAPLPICLMITALGLQNLLNLFRFGLKKMIINSEHLIYFQWKVKKISWEEIDDIQLKNVFQQEYLYLILKKGKPIEIHLNGTQLNISSELIYEKAVENWYRFFEGKNSYE